jgi:hypothetical protein
MAVGYLNYSGKYQAKLHLGGGRYQSIGVFPTREEAQAAFDMVKAGKVPADHFKKHKRYGKGNVYVSEIPNGRPYYKAEWRGKHVVGGYNKAEVQAILDAHVERVTKEEKKERVKV